MSGVLEDVGMGIRYQWGLDRVRWLIGDIVKAELTI